MKKGPETNEGADAEGGGRLDRMGAVAGFHPLEEVGFAGIVRGVHKVEARPVERLCSTIEKMEKSRKNWEKTGK